MLLKWLYNKVEDKYDCVPCEWGCCKAEYCHEHRSYECKNRFWYRILRFYLMIDDWIWWIKTKIK